MDIRSTKTYPDYPIELTEVASREMAGSDTPEGKKLEVMATQHKAWVSWYFRTEQSDLVEAIACEVEFKPQSLTKPHPPHA